MILRSRAPVRIDFAGGWTDVGEFAQETPGGVVNAALNVYSYATLKAADQDGQVPGAGFSHEDTLEEHAVSIYSSDFDVYVEAEHVRELEYDGNIDLVKAAIKHLRVPGGFNLITESNAPPGSGLGTSASMGVALIALLARYSGKYLLNYEIAELASTIERKELGIIGGKQDHYGSAEGGINFMEFHGEDVKTSPLNVDKETSLELEKNLVLCYTGKSRLSGDIHENVSNAFKAGEAKTVGAIERLKEIPREMKSALLSGNLDSFGDLMNQNWECQKKLHSSVTNAQIEDLFENAQKEGALGAKAGGAGGGGCLIFYCSPDSACRVRRMLEKKGVRIIDFNFDYSGVVTWAV